MTDYKSMITPYLDSIRNKIAKEETARIYTRRLNESIEFFNSGNFVPDEAFYSALEAHLSEKYQQSTINGWIKLTRRFFDWTLKHEALLPLIQPDSNEHSNEEAPEMHYTHAQEKTLQAEHEPERAVILLPPHEEEQGVQLATDLSPHVDAQHAQELPRPPQEQQGGTASNTLHSGRPRKSDEPRSKKLSIYLTPTLEADVKDLARIQALSTPDYIFRILQRETERRAKTLATFRTLKED